MTTSYTFLQRSYANFSAHFRYIFEDYPFNEHQNSSVLFLQQVTHKVTISFHEVKANAISWILQKYIGNKRFIPERNHSTYRQFNLDLISI